MRHSEVTKGFSTLTLAAFVSFYPQSGKKDELVRDGEEESNPKLKMAVSALEKSIVRMERCSRKISN